MFHYCFEFKSDVALTDKAQMDIANNIRANSPGCSGIQIDEYPGADADKEHIALIDDVCGD